MKTDNRTRPEVRLKPSDYQPSRAELEEDVRVEATFEEAVDALCQPVTIRYTDEPRRK